MPTDLRHDLDYLKQLLKHSIRLRSTARSTDEVNMLADISDYMICLVLDALTDHVLAKKLLMLFLKL